MLFSVESFSFCGLWLAFQASGAHEVLGRRIFNCRGGGWYSSQKVWGGVWTGGSMGQATD